MLDVIKKQEKIQKSLMKDIKILLKKKKTKSKNMGVNVIRIPQKLKNKDQLSIEIMKREKVTAMLLDKVSVFSYKSR